MISSQSEGIPVPLPAGACTFHHGRTLHYTRGNSTNAARRAFITNFRPKEMIELERENGFDHGKKVKEFNSDLSQNALKYCHGMSFSLTYKPDLYWVTFPTGSR